MNECNEKSIATTYCVIYHIEAGQWVVNGNGWSQIHLFHDVVDNTYRLIGWSVNDFGVVLNRNLTSKCAYTIKSRDFHKFVDDERKAYGLGFYSKEESIEDCEKFYEAVNSALNEIQKQHLDANTSGKEKIVARPRISKTAPTTLTQPLSNSLLHTKDILPSPTSELTIPPASPVVPQLSPDLSTSTPSEGPKYPDAHAGKLFSPTALPNRAMSPPPLPLSKAPRSNNSVCDPRDSITPTSLYPTDQLRSSPNLSTPQSPSASASPPPLPTIGAYPRLTVSTSTTVSPAHSPLASPTAFSNDASRATSPIMHRETSEQMEEFFKNGVLPLGNLKILPSKQRKASTVTPSHKAASGVITDPISIIHTQHVKYNPQTRQYTGLPPEWVSLLNRQFGIAAGQLESVVVPPYKSRIPAVLVQMKDFLFAHGGLECEGIFRIAPSAGESTYVKQLLNENKFDGEADCIIMANLIKVWYRELPEHILNCLDEQKIDVKNEVEAGEVMQNFLKEPQLSYFQFLLDICVDVSRKENLNKMSSKNLAIVITPNLFTPTSANAIAHTQKMANFVHRAIDYRASLSSVQK